MKPFLAYAKARENAYLDALYYQSYTSDLLKGLYEKLGGSVSGRYYDLIKDRYKAKPNEKQETAEQIIDRIKKKLGGL